MARKFENLPENQLHFLLDELKNGNDRAFEYIYTLYYKSLTRLSYSIIKDLDKAESLVQDVLIKLWEKRRDLDNVLNIQAYLMMMVRNISIDYLRKEKASQKAHRKNIPNELVNTTEDQISRNEFEEKLLQSISKLPERCRTAFELSRFENRSNKEIAETMNISVKGVEALIGRSLALLRTELIEFLPSGRIRKKNSSLFFFSFLRKRLSFS